MPREATCKTRRRAAPTVPLANPGARFWRQGKALRAAMDRVVASGYYVLGPEVEAFEEELAEWVGADHAVGVANGTDAITVALRALGVGPGDEVVTVSHTAVPTVAAIELTGATPVLVDIERTSLGMSPSALEAAIGPRTAAVVVVHMYGHPAPIRAIAAICEQHHLALVEDCAQAHGARVDGQHVGTFGDAGTFSFYPTKNLGAMGDGGAVFTSSVGVAERVRRLRQYGWAPRGVSQEPGMNTRLDELQAAILRVGLASLDEDVARRRAIAARYGEELALHDGVAAPSCAAGCAHAYHLYVVRHPEPDALGAALGRRGIATGRHYPQAVHQQPAYAGRLRCPDGLRETEQLYREHLSLPMFPELSDAQVDRVVAALRRSLAGG